MKPSIVKLPLFILVMSAVFTLSSCSTEVMLYEDYKDIPVVFGLINVKADTNFIKITKAFCSDNEHPVDPYGVALVYDSSNYPGRLDAYFEELKSTPGLPFQPTGRKLLLDTITIHNKQAGIFYAPHQKLYYTAERFKTNTATDKYRYKLYVVKPDLDTVTSEIGIVNGDITIGTNKMNFQAEPSDARASLLFTSTEEAVLYELGMKFVYREIHEGQPMQTKEVSWSYGTRPLDAYEQVSGHFYKLPYSVNTLFDEMESAIGSDTVWDVNHPEVIRYMDHFSVTISAAAEDFYTYYQYTQAMQSGLVQSSEYSNIEGGWGLLSSRIFLDKTVQLSAKAKYDLFNKPWGFKEQ